MGEQTLRRILEYASRCVQAEQQTVMDADELRLRTAERLEQALALLPSCEMRDEALRPA